MGQRFKSNRLTLHNKGITFQLIVGTLVLGLAGCGRNPEHINRLAHASSPYLREHADNPVDWYEWGAEALEKAKKEDKPLIISIGYASCHWCHVMEEESFMDTAVARLMNDNFVSIKVDREERPDIDQIYLNAAELTSGNAGWPLNAFALPNGKPFYAATYFPKAQWMQMLNQILEVRKNNNSNLTQQARELAVSIKMLDERTRAQNVKAVFDRNTYQGIFPNWQSALDFESGGLAGAPKFPMPVVGEFLLQQYYLTGNTKSLEWVITTLDAMARGGIYDPLGGGFSRYATDAHWRIPHFEKMLYDNGQLVSLYAHAYQVTGHPNYAEIIRETLEFIKLEMTSPDGGFYSSLNADSEGKEGYFYGWSKTEIEKLLGPEKASVFVACYNILDTGNWEEGKNILYRNQSHEEFARNHAMTVDQWEKILNESKQILLTARNKRIHPSLDNKILTGWNALMLQGYVDAYLATGHQPYLETALKNAAFLEKKMVRDKGRLWREAMGDKVSIDAFLDDYAALAQAYMHLYEATFDIHWLALARTITDYAVQHFRDEQSGLFYYTSNESEFVVARKMELTDQVIPSSNAMMGNVLFRLGQYYDNSAYHEMSQSLLSSVTRDLTGKSPSYAHWARLMGLMTYQPYQVAIVGTGAMEKSRQLQQHYLPTAIFMGGENENLPLLENKLIQGETIIYVCRNKICKLPTKEVDQALQQLTFK